MENPFDKVPLDCLRCILQPFQRTEESFFMSLVCRRWNSVIEFPQPRLNYADEIVHYYAKRGNLSALVYLTSKKLICPSNHFSVATDFLSCRNYEALRWALNNGFHWFYSDYLLCLQLASETKDKHLLELLKRGYPTSDENLDSEEDLAELYDDSLYNAWRDSVDEMWQRDFDYHDNCNCCSSIKKAETLEDLGNWYLDTNPYLEWDEYDQWRAEWLTE